MLPLSLTTTKSSPGKNASEDTFVVRGIREVLALEPILAEFALSCEQEGAVADLSYFLRKPGFLKRSPVLILFPRRPWAGPLPANSSDLAGAVLLYEYRVSGLSTRIYSSNDRSGRSTVLGHSSARAALAARAANHLVGRGAQGVLLSFRSEGDSLDLVRGELQEQAHPVSWTIRQRSVPDYLMLHRTYDETLASIGQRTRSNLRYYRRRAEKELGCRFLAAVSISLRDLLAFNRVCMYPVPDGTVRSRYTALQELKAPVLMGLQDSEGRWLSLIGARRFKSHSEILWQMNRNGLLAHSISLVARGYMIEHEIGQGAKRFYIEGGCPHPIRHSFVQGSLSDLVLVRRSVPGAVLRKLASNIFEEENELAQALFDPSLPWYTAGQTVIAKRSAPLPT